MNARSRIRHHITRSNCPTNVLYVFHSFSNRVFNRFCNRPVLNFSGGPRIIEVCLGSTGPDKIQIKLLLQNGIFSWTHFFLIILSSMKNLIQKWWGGPKKLEAVCFAFAFTLIHPYTPPHWSPVEDRQIDDFEMLNKISCLASCIFSLFLAKTLNNLLSISQIRKMISVNQIFQP